MKKLLGLLLISLILTPLAHAGAYLYKPDDKLALCMNSTWSSTSQGSFVCGPNQNLTDPVLIEKYQTCIKTWRQGCCDKYKAGTTYTFDAVQGAICK